MVESMMLSELVLPNLSVTSECLFSVGYTYPDVTENDTYIRVDSSIYTVETDPLAKILFNTHKLRVATSNPQQTSSLLKPVLQKLNDHYKTNVSAYYLNVPPSDFFSQLDNGAVDMICDLSWENLMTLYTNKPAQDYRTTCPEMGYSLQVVSNIPGVKTTEELYKQINEMLMLNYLVQSCDVSKETSYFLNIYFPGIKLISMQECEKAFNESMIPTVAPFKAGSMDEETLKNILSGKLRLSTGLVLPISSIFPKEEPYPENTVARRTSLKDYEFGNQQLSDLYNEVLEQIIQCHWIQGLLQAYSVPSVIYSDCISEFPVLPREYYNGTAGNILKRKNVNIGISSPAKNRYPLFFDEELSTLGIIPAIEDQIFVQIGIKLNIHISIKYTWFSDTGTLLKALENGKIDVTSLYCFPEAIENNYRVNTKFQRSCAAYGQQFYFLTEKSSNIINISGLLDFLNSTQKKVVGVTPISATFVQTTLRGLITQVQVNSTNGELLQELIEGRLVVILPDFVQINATSVIAFGDNPNKTIVCDRTLLNEFDAGIIIPSTSYFRRDKVHSCGNQVLEQEMGEYCEKTDQRCTEKCDCNVNSKRIHEGYGCEYGPWKVGVPSAMAALIVLIIFFIAICIIGLLNKEEKTRSKVDGARKSFNSNVVALKERLLD
eukprot:TRINITY_DN1354_c0_g2_i4.p1 TRINITY_DN1354_c0_g2~~TRINITY_DN1354_c0_g2_i4.p1  ORF type:complete len:662 (-),score=78.21 TRINITY_DN1354_c0_g2_i4:78-2063(-)